MSTMVWGVKITLDDSASPVTENTDIGLYNVVSSNSEIRLIQNSISGVTTWKEGLIIELGDYGKKIGDSFGDFLEQAHSVRVEIVNTNQFSEELSSRSVALHGLKFQIYLFTNTTAALQWTGFCEQPSWDSKIFSITAKNLYQKRVANITEKIGETNYPNATKNLFGATIPVTFGTFKKWANPNTGKSGYNPARYQRTSDNIVKKNNWQLFDTGIYPEKSTVFPIYSNGTAPSLTFDIQFVDDLSSPGVITEKTTAYNDLYMKVVEGSGVDQIRRITQITTVGMTAGIARITVESYFSTEPSDQSADRSYIEIVEVNQDFECDTWQCDGLITEAGVSTSIPDIYTYNEDTFEFNPAPSFGYKYKSGDSEKNKLDIDLKFFDDSDSLKSFKIIPIKSAKWANISTAQFASQWGTIFSETWKRKTEGIYYSSDYFKLTSSTHSNDWGYLYDKNSSTYNYIYAVPKYDALTYKYGFAWTALLPECPSDFTFDNCYIVLKYKIYCNDLTGLSSTSGRLGVKTRKILSSGSSLLAQTGLNADNTYPTECFTFDNMLQSYFGVNGTDERNFFYNNSSGTPPLQTLSGYSLISLGVDDKKEYDNIMEVLFLHTVQHDGDVGLNPILRLEIYECAVLFERSEDISKNIYAHVKGRVANNTWGGRVLSADLLINPHRLFEHVCRLQNWSENSTTPTLGWGKAYGDNALIKTTGTGSFDSADPDFAAIKSFVCNAQIQEYESCYTNAIKLSISREFQIASYIDNNGYECIQRIIKPTDLSATPSDSITLADIIDRSRIMVYEKNINDIYTEPFVNYYKNNASGSYERIIKISNPSAASFSSSYVDGLSGTLAETYWTKCKTLWQKCRVSNRPPSDLTDLVWANDPDDADNVAKNYITSWIDFMFYPIIEFPVHFLKAGAYSSDTWTPWDIGHKFNLTLPHHTNGDTVVCQLIGYRTNPNPPYDVMIRAIMFTTAATDTDFMIQDTMTGLSGNYDWQDHMDTYAERGEGIDDRQDVY